MKQYNHYFFDLYGTLVDIRTDENSIVLWRQMYQLYRRYGVDFKSPIDLRKYYRKACREGFQKACEKQHSEYGEMDLLEVFEKPLQKVMQSETKQIAMDIAQVFRTLSMKKLCVYHDTISTLQSLKQQHKKIYLLSNAQSIFTIAELKMLGLYDYFDQFYISSDYGIKKPDPNFLKQQLDNLDIRQEECVMIGNDFHSDIAIAQSCKIDSIFINSDHYTKKEIHEFLTQFENPNTITIMQNLSEILGGQ